MQLCVIEVHFRGGRGAYVTSRVRTRGRDTLSSFCAEHRTKAKTWRFCGTMGRRCVAAGCSNTHSDSISMHKFPKDPELRRKWEKQVQRTRERWSATDTSVLCSEHFEADCFEVDSMLAEQMGLKKRRRLKPDAVPTVFVRHGIPKDAAGQESLAGSSSSGETSSTTAHKRAQESSSTVETDGPPKKRMAFEKRERLRASQLYLFTHHTDLTSPHMQ